MELVAGSGDRRERVELRRTPEGLSVRIGERSYRVDVERHGPVLTLLVEGRQTELVVSPNGDGSYFVSGNRGVQEVEIQTVLEHLAATGRGGSAARGTERVSAMMPGRVVSVLVAEGEAVEPGAGVVVLEAMKMENEIQADVGGVIKAMHVEPGQAVETGDPLFDIGPAPDEA